VGGQIDDVAFDPRAAGVAWAAAGQRLFKSVDHGATWSLIYEDASFSFRKLAIVGDADVLVAATSNGIARSEDGGASWTLRGLGGLSVSSLLVHPAQPLRMYAGIRGVGVVRSNDGGLSWSSIDFGVPYGDFPSMATDPADPDVLIVAALEQDGLGAIERSALLRTNDGGQTWAPVVDSPRSIVYEVASCAANPDVLYASAANYYGGTSGVLRSNDRGVTWSLVSGLAGKLVTDVAIAPSDCDSIYAVHYGAGLERSTDGGATFSGPLTEGIPFYNRFPRHVAVDPTSPARLIGSSHGGVLSSLDAGDHFAVVGGVMNLAVRSLATSPLEPWHLWMATWGSGVWTRPSEATPFARASLDVDYAFDVAPSPVVSNETFVGTWSVPFVTTDGATFSAIALTPNPMAFAFDPASAAIVYMATQKEGLYKSVDGGATFARSNGALVPWATGAGTFIDMRAVAFDAGSSGRLFIGTNGRGVLRSDDGGVTLDAVAPTLSDKLVSCLVPVSPGVVYACVGGSGVAESTDGGATFAYVNSGLESLDVVALAFDAPSGRLFAATPRGVSVSSLGGGGGGGWRAFGGDCLPSGGAGALTILGSGAGRKLVVGTGRGLFTHAL
jgi:photosystem II stability/assembly factor-like uncharacterized protein